MKAMMHWVSRSAEKIRFPTIAAIFPMVARMLILVALQQKDQFLSIIFISREDVSPFLASTDTDDKRRIEDSISLEIATIRALATSATWLHDTINFSGITRGCADESAEDTVASKRCAYIFARHYLNGTGITSTFTAVTILPAILVVTITAAASVSMYGGDCAQFIPKLLATDIRRAATATMMLFPLIYELYLQNNRLIA